MPTSTAETCEPRQAGFTLVELSLVLVVLTVVLALGIPFIRDLSGLRLESAARRLASTARYLREDAVLRGRVYRLHYAVGGDRYWTTVLEVRTGGPEFVESPDALTRPTTLPEGVTFADVTVTPRGQVTTGEVLTHFYPEGNGDPTVIHLANRDGQAYTIVVPPLLGPIPVYAGYRDVDGTLTAAP